MQRERLTITLKKDVLRVLDNYIDGFRIRNRSHAIEYILTKQLLPSTVKVMILVGGRGIKLRPITYEIPKALIPIHDKPLLEYTISTLAENNLKDIILAIGYLGDKIKDHFGDGSKYGVKFTYLEENGKNTGTVMPLIEAKNYLENKPFLVINGDVLADIDFIDLLDFHKTNKSLATVALTSIDKPSDWGVAQVQGNKIVEFQEKPKQKVSSHLINAGIYVFSPEIFQYLNKDQETLSKDVFPNLAKEGKLFGYLFKGQWHDVGSPKAYEKVLKEWRK